ncbi:MAG: hypothetical protein ACOYMW_00955 [Candidatus Competibacteraceae bacterium]
MAPRSLIAGDDLQPTLEPPDYADAAQFILSRALIHAANQAVR